LPVGQKVWKETRVLLPKTSPKRWTNIFTGDQGISSVEGNFMLVGDVLQSCPVSLLVKAAEKRISFPDS